MAGARCGDQDPVIANTSATEIRALQDTYGTTANLREVLAEPNDEVLDLGAGIVLGALQETGSPLFHSSQ